MTEFNPLATSILGSVQQQRILAVEKSRRARQADILEGKVAAEDDELEHQVERSDSVHTISDENAGHGQPPPDHPHRHPHASEESEDDAKPHIDVTG